MSLKSVHISETPATHWLKKHGVSFEPCAYDYVEHGGTSESARQLGVNEHAVIKTLVMQDDKAQPMVVLMHGDCTVSTKNLARQIGVKAIEPCKPEAAQRHSGYQVGGTSPFGLRKPLPIYFESSIVSLEKIWINGGRRGFLIAINSNVLVDHLQALPVLCALRQESE
jgi:Cys-tRNA(Pro) deacylase